MGKVFHDDGEEITADARVELAFQGDACENIDTVALCVCMCVGGHMNYDVQIVQCTCTCTRGSSFFLGKITALGVLCCFALLFV